MPLAFDKADPQIWWGEFAANEGEINKLQIGPSQFWITRYAQEWRIAHLQEEANELAEVKLEPLSQASDIPGEAQINHFSFQQSPKSLFFTPMLADRPVVMKPEHPFYIQSGAEVTIYVTTSLWLRISTGEHSGILRTYPLYRPSDTWFGSSTREGELCYASRIKGRLRLLDVAMLPHRALTPLRIHNRAKEPLMLEKVKLPVMYLALYKSDNMLWTQSLTLIREEGGDLAAIRLGKAAPREITKAERVTDPRQKAEKNMVLRAFSRLFSHT